MPIPTSDFIFEEGDWSPTQTFDMSSVSSPAPTADLNTPGVTIIVVLVAVLAVVGVLLLLIKRKNKRIRSE